MLEDVAREERWLGVETGFDRKARAERIRSHLEHPAYGAFAAFDANKLIAQCAVHESPAHPHTVAIVIAQPYRGIGLGRTLMTQLETFAKERNVAELGLLVFAHNDRAIALYRNMGYIQREYYPGDVIRKNGAIYDTIFMTKSLTPPPADTNEPVR